MAPSSLAFRPQAHDLPVPVHVDAHDDTRMAWGGSGDDVTGDRARIAIIAPVSDMVPGSGTGPAARGNGTAGPLGTDGTAAFEMAISAANLLGGTDTADGAVDDTAAGLEPRCPGRFDPEPPVPQWVLDATAEHDRADLASAAHSALPGLSGRASAGMRALELCDPAELSAAGHARAVLDGIVVAQRMIARLQAIQQRWIAAFARPGVAVPMNDVVDAVGTSVAGTLGAELPYTEAGMVDVAAVLAHPLWRPAVLDTASRFAAAEVACATRLAPVTARMRVERAQLMVDTLPATLAAQQAGELDGYRAAIIADGVAALPADARSRVERNIVAGASSCTASELRRRVARAVIAADPAGAAERAATAAQSRRTSVTAVENDMALFQAVLAAPDALTAQGVLDAIAASLTSSGLADGRGSAQLRADAFADLFQTLATTGRAHIGVPRGSIGAARGSSGAAHDPIGAARGATGIAPCRCGAVHSDSRRHRPAIPEPGTARPGCFTSDPAGSPCPCLSSSPCPCPAGSPCPCLSSSPCPGTTGLAVRAPRVALNVYLDGATLAGMADRPGEIAGYGTVTAGTARALAASAATIRALVTRSMPVAVPATDPAATSPGASPATSTSFAPARAASSMRAVPPAPAPGRVGTGRVGIHSLDPGRARVCGSAVDPGRAVYRPPEATADHVRARDRHCQFPGCHTPAERCDIDHRIPYQQGGATCPCNLDILCRTHHRLKTFTAWTATPDPGTGRLTWTSPLGHTYMPADEPCHPSLPSPHSPCAGRDDPPPF